MLISIIHNSVALGTGSNVPLYPAVFDLQPTTTAFSLQALYVLGTADVRGSWPVVRFVTAIDTLPATIETCYSLAAASGFIKLQTNPLALRNYAFSPVLSPKGLNLYLWIEDVTLSATATLTVKLIEFP